MKKIYTLLAVLILSSHFGFAQCTDFNNNNYSFTNFQVINPVLVWNGGTPGDPTDDQYSGELYFYFENGASSNPFSYNPIDGYEFIYAGYTFSETGFALSSGDRFINFNWIGMIPPSSFTNITIREINLFGPDPLTGGDIISFSSCNSLFPVIYVFSAPLNIVSLNLNVTNDNNANHLKWDVVNTQDIKSTSIEYSTDGSIFETLYQTNTPLTNYTHKQLLGTKHFYRIKFTDNQNQVNYSSLAKIETSSGKSDFNVTNTIIQNELVLSAEQNKSITICDMQGLVLKKLDLKAGTQTIDLHHLSSGIYLVKSNNKTIKVVKI
jgi:hypothetical protein